MNIILYIFTYDPMLNFIIIIIKLKMKKNWGIVSI